MGWASGGQLFEDVWNEVRRHIPDYKREEICGKIMSMFEDFDCDTLAEAMDRNKPEIAFCVYQGNSDYFDDMVEMWHDEDVEQQIHEYLGVTEDQYARLVEKRS